MFPKNVSTFLKIQTFIMLGLKIILTEMVTRCLCTQIGIEYFFWKPILTEASKILMRLSAGFPQALEIMENLENH